MSERVNVLVFGTNSNLSHAIKTLPKEAAQKYNFVIDSTIFSTLQEYLEHGRKIMKEKNIQVVVSLCSDSQSLLKAALAQEYNSFQGPSMESAFLCFHKYYTHLLIDQDPIPYSFLDLSSNDLDRECEQALDKVGLPAFFKPCTSVASKGVSSIDSVDELKEVAENWISKGRSTCKSTDPQYVKSFLENNIDIQMYPLATVSMALVQQYMKNTLCVNADGYVYNGEIFHWSISDNLYSITKPQYMFGTAHPSSLPKYTQSQIWKIFDEVTSRLIEFGFNNSFLNVEVFVQESGEVKLMEINPRLGGSLSSLCEVSKESNCLLAELQLAQGVKPKCPVLNGKHTLYGYVRTCGSGKVKELLNLKQFTLENCKPEQEVNGSVDAGVALTKVCISGNSRREVLDKYWTVCRQLLLQPELSIWE